MALYFNTSNGPVSFVMRDGSSGMIAPKKWQEIAPSLETSASILKLVKQGVLVRREEAAPVQNTSSKPMVAAPVAAAPAPAPSKSVSIPSPAPIAAPAAEVKPAPSPAPVPVKAAIKEPVKPESGKVAKEVAVSESSSTSSKDSK